MSKNVQKYQKCPKCPEMSRMSKNIQKYPEMSKNLWKMMNHVNFFPPNEPTLPETAPKNFADTCMSHPNRLEGSKASNTASENPRNR